jgi:hypothetical protein
MDEKAPLAQHWGGQMDTFLLNRTQLAYDWLFDRTGVYNATLRMGFLLGMISPDLIRGRDVGISMFFIGFWGIINGIVYWWQDTKRYTEYNNAALNWEINVTRRIGVPIVLLWVVTMDIFVRRLYWDIPSDFCMIIYSYIATCTIRDRNPPEKEVRGLAWRIGNV